MRLRLRAGAVVAAWRAMAAVQRLPEHQQPRLPPRATWTPPAPNPLQALTVTDLLTHLLLLHWRGWGSSPVDGYGWIAEDHPAPADERQAAAALFSRYDAAVTGAVIPDTREPWVAVHVAYLAQQPDPPAPPSTDQPTPFTAATPAPAAARQPRPRRASDAALVIAAVVVAGMAGTVWSPIAEPRAPAVPVPLVQTRPVPAMCTWAAAVQHTAAVPPLLRPPTAGVADRLAPVTVQLPATGRTTLGTLVRLQPGRYSVFTTRSTYYDIGLDYDPATMTWYHRHYQHDLTTWHAADQTTITQQQLSWDSGRWPASGTTWSARPAPPAHTPDGADPADPDHGWWLATTAWSSNPAVLAGQVSMWDPHDPRPTYVLAAIAMRYRQTLPTMTQHAAALTVLCTTPGLHVAGRTVDLAGRPGIAIVGKHDYGSGVIDHDTLILDPTTWRPQSHAHTTTGYSTAFTNDRVDLLLDAGTRTVLG
ncbi:hypothetical protein ACPPVO_35975 [Dactylosporangium sp. McL0621]|uniref:hypothetical protein n=1 Tax=Dactylosporangium sp. McL0621 TaxID=3415678 RepID=UPI003CF89702